MKERKAKPTGLCPVRSALFATAFDELIRQTAVDSAPGGALLTRVRDQLAATTDAYAALYEASVAFAVAKSTVGEGALPALEAAAADAQARKDDLLAEEIALRGRIDAAQRRASEVRALADKRRGEELGCLRVQAKSLDAFLKSRS